MDTESTTWLTFLNRVGECAATEVKIFALETQEDKQTLVLRIKGELWQFEFKGELLQQISILRSEATKPVDAIANAVVSKLLT